MKCKMLQIVPNSFQLEKSKIKNRFGAQFLENGKIYLIHLVYNNIEGWIHDELCLKTVKPILSNFPPIFVIRYSNFEMKNYFIDLSRAEVSESKFYFSLAQNYLTIRSSNQHLYGVFKIIVVIKKVLKSVLWYICSIGLVPNLYICSSKFHILL